MKKSNSCNPNYQFRGHSNHTCSYTVKIGWLCNSNNSLYHYHKKWNNDAKQFWQMLVPGVPEHPPPPPDPPLKLNSSSWLSIFSGINFSFPSFFNFFISLEFYWYLLFSVFSLPGCFFLVRTVETSGLM